MQPQPIAIIGANGYSGIELIHYLSQHPAIAEIDAYARDNSWHIQHELPHVSTKQVHSLNLDQFNSAKPYAAIFLATPASVSMQWVAQHNPSQHLLIDLSGAFRLPAEQFASAYQLHHTQPELLSQAKYGLSPWATAQNTKLIANPGCYATAILMALLPLLKNQIIDPEHIIIDAKSGVSGGGRQAQAALQFCAVNDNCLPYKIGCHQHLPEIIHYCQKFAGPTIQPMMTTHLLPIKRGIICSLYLKFAKQATTSPDKSSQLTQAYQTYYGDYPLIRYQALDSDEALPSLLALDRVIHTPFTHISWQVMNNAIYLFVTLDNLLKGAATQAIENFNQQFNLPVATGLSNYRGNL